MGLKSVRNLLLLVGVALLAGVALTARVSATSLAATSAPEAQYEPAVGAAPSGTSVSGVLTANTTWTAAGSPYTVVGNVTVLPTVTLTIDPGVEVDFNQSLDLLVNGTVLAVGTSANPITFTGTMKSPGWWGRIAVIGTAAPISGSVFSHVLIEDGGYYSGSTDLYVENATVSVSDSLIRNSAKDGIIGGPNGTVHLSNDTFTGNNGFAVKFTDGSVNPQLANLTASGNTVNAIGWGNGTMTGAHVWPAIGIPYNLYYNGISIAPNGSLTIHPGVEVDFNQNAGIEVNGLFSAVGTPANPITFTGTSKTRGWWSRIGFLGTPLNPISGSTIDYAIIEYAGYYSGSADVYAYNASVNVSNSIIRNSSKDGIVTGEGGVVNLTSDTFTGNQGYAVHYVDGSVNPQLSNLSASGNISNAIGWGNGNLTGTHLWPNAGLRYELYYNGVTVMPNSTLVISPGVEIDFGQNAGIEVNGTLTAVGTPSQPITFTGTSKTPGWWNHIGIVGNVVNRLYGSAISYATIEYSGYYGGSSDVYITFATATLSHNIIRNSSKDGVRIGLGGSGSLIEGNQIVGNAGYGLKNDVPSQVVMAANNWWGDPSGPNVDGGCNSGGTGSRVSAGVAVKPFLTSASASPDPLAPSDVRTLQLTPARWFVPADGVSRAYITATLTDGSGVPVPGRTVHVLSTRGAVVDGGITDVQGKTLAYLTSATVGDADLTAALDLTSACETARSALSKVTFTAPTPGGDLMPNAKAPYLNDGIEISPLPIIQGVPTTIRVTLVNPNAFTITVNGIFGFAQSGIGLTFGPIGEVQNLVVPAHGQAVAQTVWAPLIAGHYCFRFDGSYQVTGALAPASPALKDFDAQHNVNVSPAPFIPPDGKKSLNQARLYTGRISDGSTILDGATSKGAALPVSFIQSFMYGNILDRSFDAAEQISKNLGGDPPSQDYKTLATLRHFTFTPVQPGPNVPAALAQALNDNMTAALDMVDKGRAGSLSLDRYAGAAEAHDTTWESLQASAFFYYKLQFGQAAIAAADKLDALRQELIAEGYTDITVSVAAYQAYQQRLATQGYSAQEIQSAHAVGLTDAEIEQIRQETIANDPAVGAGDIIQKFADVSGTWRSAGQQMLAPPFIGGGAVGGHLLADTPNYLARIFNTDYTLTIGNPTTQTATIDLVVRRVDVPADWSVTAPLSLTLAPGAQSAVTVTVQAGTAVVQDTQPRVAIEGYIANALIGGVALDVAVPYAELFDGKLRQFLPSLQR